MSMFSEISLRKKLLFLVLLLAIIVVIASISLIMDFRKINAVANSIETNEMPLLVKADEIKLSVVQVQQWLTDISATRAQDGLNDGFDEAAAHAERFHELMKELKQLDPEKTVEYEQMIVAFDAYYATGKKMAQAYIDQGPAGGNSMMPEFDKVAAAITDRTERMQAHVNERVGLALQQQKQFSDNALIKLWISAGVVIVFVLMFYFIMSRALADLPVMVEQLRRFATGDLRAAKALERHDEIGDLSRSLNTMRDNLVDMISRIMDMASQLSNASDDMSTIMAQANNNVQQQRTETDQVATAMNEMTATVHEVANNINHAASAAQEASTESHSGQQVVSQTVSKIQSLASGIEQAAETIHRLEQNSQKITAVLDVIKGVADQTNLLALNAAIEAARAGEQGRGFAVVADEVRTLASRTQQSTEEINSMIGELHKGTHDAVDVMNNSRDNARSMVDQASAASASLSSIARAVDRIHEMSNQIASSAEEQSAVSEEINRNIVKISDMTENTAESAGRVTLASEELSQLAMHLKQVCQQFRLA